MVAPPSSSHLLSVVCRDGAGEGQGWPLAVVGREAEPEGQVAGGRPRAAPHLSFSAALLRSPISLPLPRALPARAKRASALRVWRPPPLHPANWGAFFLPDFCGEHVPETMLCMGRQIEGRPGKGKIQVAAPAQPSPSPSWTQGQGHWPFSWLDGAWEKNLRFLSLRVKMTQEQPCGEMGGTPGGQL